MCAAEVWAENEEWLPSAQVPPAENANTHTGFSLPQSALSSVPAAENKTQLIHAGPPLQQTGQNHTNR